MSPANLRTPSRGEIWWAHMPTDPPDKPKRPVIVVSLDFRNHHPRSNSVLVVPLSTSIHREMSTHLLFKMGETGLPADSMAQAENVCTILRATMAESRGGPPRTVPNLKICQLAKMVQLAMGCTAI